MGVQRNTQRVFEPISHQSAEWCIGLRANNESQDWEGAGGEVRQEMESRRKEKEENGASEETRSVDDRWE